MFGRHHAMHILFRVARLGPKQAFDAKAAQRPKPDTVDTGERQPARPVPAHSFLLLALSVEKGIGSRRPSGATARAGTALCRTGNLSNHHSDLVEPAERF
jgi:hypothetical protein